MASRDPIKDFFSFLLGGVLFSMGAFLFFNQVMVSSVPMGGFRLGRRFAGGWDGGYGSGWGWFLVLASAAALAVGILQTLIMSFQPTSLWNVLTMFALIGSGGGLMFRSLMAYDDGKERQDR